MTTISMNNLDKVEKFVAELGPKEEKVLSKTNLQFMKNIRRTAKLMAPRDTGELAESIRLKPTKIKGKTKQFLLEVGAWHASAQEYGFAPHYAYVRNSSKLAPGVYFVKKNTPFIRPAIEKNFSKFSQSLNLGIKEATKI